MSDADAGKEDVALAEVKVTATSSGSVTGMSPADFIAYLRANGYKGNASFNDTHPGMAWIGFWNNK